MIIIKLWIDDVRPAPEGYIWARSTNEAILIIGTFRQAVKYLAYHIEESDTLLWFDVIDIDHDAGDYVEDGGDYIKVLDWMEAHKIKAPIHIHSMNPVGVQNMRNIIKRNGWMEV